MEVHGRQPHEPSDARERLRRQEERLAGSARARTREFLEQVNTPHSAEATDRVRPEGPETPVLRSERRAQDAPRDVVDLSHGLTRPETDPERANRVQLLRRAHESGQLLTPEFVERAATRMLGGPLA